MSADAVHRAGITGDGVTVAVIDSGFNATNPEIADNVVDVESMGSSSFENTSGEHGTATAEIVVDTAPNVNLVLVSAPNLYGLEIQKALEHVRENTSADIVTMSLGYSTGPFDGTSVDADLIETNSRNGIAHVNAAGNQANGTHYHSTWSDPDGNGFMNFTSTDESLGVDVPTGQSAAVYVNWDDFPGSDQDYDVYLVNASGDVVDYSDTTQSGSNRPIEVVSISNAQDSPYHLYIDNFSATRPAEFQIFGTSNVNFEYSTSAQSLARPAGEETAITAGAVYHDDGTLEAFSSRGPTVDGRLKPDIVAPDGVSSSVYGDSPDRGFYGTSAAAPHAAGVLALVHEANPSLTTAEQKNVLTGTADVVQGNEPNNQTGYGVVNASGAVEAVSTVDVSSGQTLVVAQDGSGDYTTIQSAVDAAADGDTVEVRPGTYEERVIIFKNITLTAPAGATLQNSSSVSSFSGVYISGSAKPTVSGFTLTGWSFALNGYRTNTSWTVRNVTIENGRVGLVATESTGDWTLKGSTVQNLDGVGLSAYDSTGDWTIEQSVVRNTSGHGIATDESIGNWNVRDTTITEADTAIDAYKTAGNWTVTNATITRSDDAIAADNSMNDWAVRNTTISDIGVSQSETGVGIDAFETSGNWTVTNTRVTNTDLGVNSNNASANWAATNVTIRDSIDGIIAEHSTGDWTVQRTEISDTAGDGVLAINASGAWTIENSVIQDTTQEGVEADRTDGDWVIRETRIQNTTEGVDALFSTGNWTVDDSVIHNSSSHGVFAVAVGDWTVRDTAIEETPEGIEAHRASGEWVVRNSTIRNATVGINATNTTGSWEIHESVFVDTPDRALNATGAQLEGNATYNYWDASDGPSGDFPGSGEPVVGNVTVEPFYTDETLSTTETFSDGPVTGTLIVDKSNASTYDAIQPAIDAAADTATIEVRPGTYEEALSVEKNVTIVAPEGATLDGANVATDAGINIGDDAPLTPSIDGVTVENFPIGVYADGTTDAWTLTNVTVRNADGGSTATADGTSTLTHTSTLGVGVSAANTSGDWVTHRLTVEDTTEAGILAEGSTGAWTVSGTTIRESDTGIDASDTVAAWQVVDSSLLNNSIGLFAGESDGAWRVRDTVVRNSTYAGVSGAFSSGSWTLENVTITETTSGRSSPAVKADSATGDWAVRNAVLSDNEVGVDATSSTGAWVINRTVITGNGVGVDAGGSNPAGDAAYNYWGASDGPSGDISGSGDAAVGNLTVEPFYTDTSLTTLSTLQDTTAPTAQLSVDDTTPEVNTTVVTLDASASTDNEGIVEYAWDFDGDGTLDENTTTPTTTHTFSQRGSVSAEVTVYDAAGNTDTATVTVDVQDTTDPTASLTASPSEAALSQEVTFDASGTTDNDVITTYEWDFDGDGTIDATTQAPSTTYQYSARGDYTAEVTVTDAEGNNDTATTTVSVIDTEPPEVYISVFSDRANVSEAVTFSGSDATDNVGIASYSWDFGDGTTGQGEQVDHAYDATGTYTVELTVTDEDGNQNSTSVQFTVVDEVAPSITSASATPTTAELNQTAVTLSVTAEDNVGISEYRWDIDGDGTLDRNTTTNSTTHIYTTRGDVTPTVTVVDANGNGAETALGTVSVEDTTAPQVSLTGPDNPIVNVTTTYDASGTTDNGEIVEYRWDFDSDGTAERRTTVPTVDYEYTTAGETSTITLIVEDDAGNVNDTTKTVTTTRAPTVEVTSPEDGSFVNQSDPTIVYELRNLDAVDDVADVEYRIDGGQWQSTGVLASGDIEPSLSDGEHTVEFRLVDSGGQQLSFSSARTNVTVTVDSTAPTIDSLSFTNGQVVNGSATLTATYSDATGINQSESTFLVDGSPTQVGTIGATEASVDVGQLGLADGEHTLTIAVTDEAGLTTTQQVGFVLDTTDPVIERFELDRTNVSATTPVTATVNVSEPHPADATLTVTNATGTVVYEQPITGGFGTTTNVTWTAVDDSGATVPSGTYTLTVTANDTVGHSATSVERQVTVDTDGPTVGSLSPAPGAVVNTTTPAFSATFADNGNASDTGVNTSSVTVTVDGTEVALPDGAVTDSGVSLTLDNLTIEDAGDSTHTVGISVTDNAGNTVTNRTTFTIDARGPTLDLTATPTDRISTNRPATVNVTRMDVRPNQTTVVFVPNGSTTPVTTRTLTNAILDNTTTLTWDATADDGSPVSSGEYDIILESTDKAANTNTTRATVSVDNTAPTVDVTRVNTSDESITPPTDLTTNESVRIEATASGTPGNASNVTLGVEAEFTSFEYTTAATHENGKWTATVPLAQLPDDGAYTVIAEATDPAGNNVEASTGTTVVIDRSAPEIGATLSRVDNDTGRLNVSIDDANALTDPSAFEATLTYDNGTERTVSLSTRAATAPQLTGTFPLADSVSGNYTIEVTGRDAAGNIANTTAYTDIENVSTENNTATVKFEPSGTFIQFNTTSDVSSSLTVTTSASPLAPLSPAFAGGGFLNAQLGEELETNFDNATVGIRTSSVSLPSGVSPEDAVIAFYNPDTGSWELRQNTTVRTVTLDDGTTAQYWLLTVDHFSTWGVLSSDSSAPTLESITPSDSTVSYGTTSQTVRFDYDDSLSGVNASAVTLRFNGSDVSDASGAQISSQYASYTAKNLGPGTYRASVEVVDNAGNNVTYNTTFTIPRDTRAPSLSSQSVANDETFDAGTSEVDLELTFSDGQSGLNVSNMEVYFDGSEVTSKASISGSTVSYRATGLSNNTTYTFTVKVVDNDGNSAEFEVPFSIEAAPDTGGTNNDGQVESSPSVSSGGGGGGGGGAVGARTLISVTDFITGGTTSTLTFNNPVSSISGVTIQFAEETAGQWSASVLERPPADTNYDRNYDETVVSVLDLTVPNGVADLPATMSITVKKEKLSEMGVTADQLQVEHYNESTGTWETLESSVASESSNTVTLRAETPGFSLFVVSVAPSQQSTAAVTATPTDSGPNSDATPESGSTDTPASDDAAETAASGSETTSTTFPGFGVQTVALVAALLALLVARRRD